MTASSNNTALLFISRQPAWERRVKLTQAMLTDVFTSRSGLEQRQNRQSRGRWTMRYSSFCRLADAPARRARILAEVSAPLIVPFWTERAATTSAIVANVVSIDRTPDADWFAAGDYVFFSDALLGDQFREIASVAGSALTLEPDGGAIAFLTGTRIYPCRACIRAPGSASVEVAGEDAALETMEVATL